MYGATEQSLVDAKMMWAQLDMECDELTVTLRRKNDLIKQYQQRATKLEIDLAQAQNQIQFSASDVSTKDEEKSEKKSKLSQMLAKFTPKPKSYTSPRGKAKTEPSEEQK